MRRHAFIAGLTSALVASLIAVAPSSANDLRSPDARDAIVLRHAALSDLRSADTRNVADGTTEGALAQERYYSSYGKPVPVQAPVTGPKSHFDWAPIGIGGALLLLCLVGVGVLVRTRRTVP